MRRIRYFACFAACIALAFTASAAPATTGLGATFASGVINNYLRSTAYSAVTKVYIGTGTAPTTDSGAQTDVATPGTYYAEVDVAGHEAVTETGASRATIT